MAEEKKATDLSLTVAAAQAGLRVDIFLAQADPSFSRSQIKGAIEKGDVRVNGRVPKAGLLLKEGDKVKLHMEPARVPVAVAQDIALDIVYEDSSLIVINKPAGMVVHPAPGNPDRTLVNALLHHCDELAGGGDALRPGIVHRLDKETSGLIVAAKTEQAHRHLGAQFEKRDVEKKYTALVWGDVREEKGEIARPVGRHPVDRKKMSTESRRGRDALTLWKVSERFITATLLDIELKTGRTHQIRVHLSGMGHPVVGDSVYGGASRFLLVKDTKLRAQIKAFSRQALHAAALSFVHPEKGERMVFHAPLPDDIKRLVELFRLTVSPTGKSGLQTIGDRLKA